MSACGKKSENAAQKGRVSPTAKNLAYTRAAPSGSGG
eukprot:CAMPEP_0204351778 /NCGR_PEP_ID=MMETSP0469-20131031/31377_1 /ASSEMBLY_ACC=CAM_ASM_000384 /TAXON_ID=2969 /ORGANISM="Oxyrrhis marina" /LENGTH=36 /DNA_ID= /DNA_START= /DNA_END= /DNA_ORIENTATION=